MKRRIMKYLGVLFLVSIFLNSTVEVYARAGGGGGSGSGGGGIFAIILLPFIIIGYLIRKYWINNKSKESNAVMNQAATTDQIWNKDEILERVEEIFFKVQIAWMERDQDLAKEYISEKLYKKHKTQTDQMLEQKRKNILEQINLIESKIVEVQDYIEDERDSIWVYIKGSMIDYVIDEDSDKVVSGDSTEKQAFSELWKLIRADHGWVLDQIDQEVTISKLTEFNSFTEEVGESQ
ncbi:MAG: Tim44 domain-containing protein [Bacillota bacterium]